MEATTKHQIARVISIVAHPFVMIVAIIAAAGSKSGSSPETMRGVSIVILVGIAPIVAATTYLVKKGRWTNVDASNPKERALFFLIALVAATAMIACLSWMEPGSVLVRGAVILSLMMVLALAMLPLIKLSLHMAYATLAATLLAFLGSAVACAIFAAIPALAWSRLALDRHKPAEILVGAIVGALTALLLVHGN